MCVCVSGSWCCVLAGERANATDRFLLFIKGDTGLSFLSSLLLCLSPCAVCVGCQPLISSSAPYGRGSVPHLETFEFLMLRNLQWKRNCMASQSDCLSAMDGSIAPPEPSTHTLRYTFTKYTAAYKSVSVKNSLAKA